MKLTDVTNVNYFISLWPSLGSNEVHSEYKSGLLLLCELAYCLVICTCVMTMYTLL